MHLLEKHLGKYGVRVQLRSTLEVINYSVAVDSTKIVELLLTDDTRKQFCLPSIFALDQQICVRFHLLLPFFYEDEQITQSPNLNLLIC